MGRLIAVAAAALVLAVLSAQHTAAQTPQPPLIKPEGLRQVSAHVHVIPDNSVQMVPNVGIIIGDRAMLVVDTGLGPPNGATVLAAAQKLGGSRALYLVVTHSQPEHDLGAQAFPGTAKMIRSSDQQKDIAEFGLQTAQNFASRSAINSELLKGAEYRKADITFERDYDLDLGGVKVRLSAMGANHTRGDIAIWVEPDRILFSGDIAMKAQPAFGSPYSTLRQWLVESRPAGGAQAGGDRAQPWPNRRRHDLHRWLSRLSDRGPRPCGGRETRRAQRRSGGR